MVGVGDPSSGSDGFIVGVRVSVGSTSRGVTVALGGIVSVGAGVEVGSLVDVGTIGVGVVQAESSKRENKMMEKVRLIVASPSL
jgi:hypothetical protein